MRKVFIISVLLLLNISTAVFAQVLDLNFNTLWNEINNNQVRANQTYHNRTIRISGFVRIISNNNFRLALRNDGSYFGLDVYFSSSERAKVANFNIGQRITIRGVYDGSSLGGPTIRNAIIELPEQAQPQAQPQQQVQPQAQPAQPRPAQPQAQAQQPQQQPQQNQMPSGFAPYIGTWVYRASFFSVYSGTHTIQITNNTFRISSPDQNYFFNILRWETLNNTGGSGTFYANNNQDYTLRDFPTGFQLRGARRADGAIDGIDVYLHNNGRSLIINTFGNIRVFEKQ